MRNKVAALLALAAVTGLIAQDGKDPVSRYAMDVKVRPAAQADFEKDTPKVGIEVYTDGHSSDGLYLTDKGVLAAVAAKAFKAGDPVKVKEPVFRHGLNLKARPSGQLDWDKGKKFGFEVYRDEQNGNLLYVSDGGRVAALAADAVTDATEKGKVKTPTFLHGFNLKSRKAGENDFTKDTKSFGIEVYRDEYNGNVIYVSETGAFAVVPVKLLGESKGKDPAWQHGMELSVRKAGEAKFTKDTRKIGVEVFQDLNNGTLLYLSESGGLAAVPGKEAKATGEKAKGPEWLRAMEVPIRKVGEREFTKDAKRVSVETYRDENNGTVIYVSDAGELAVIG